MYLEFQKNPLYSHEYTKLIAEQFVCDKILIVD